MNCWDAKKAFVIMKSTMVCSDHFLPEDFVDWPGAVRSLLKPLLQCEAEVCSSGEELIPNPTTKKLNVDRSATLLTRTDFSTLVRLRLSLSEHDIVH